MIADGLAPDMTFRGLVDPRGQLPAFQSALTSEGHHKHSVAFHLQ